MKRIVIIFSICFFLFFYVTWMVFFYLPVYLRTINISNIEIGILVGVFSLVAPMLALFFGLLSDRSSPRSLIQTGAGLIILSLCGLYFATNFPALLLIFVVAGAGTTLFLISLNSLYFKHLQGGKRGIKLAILMFSGHLGLGLGPLTGGLVIDFFGQRAVFLVGAIAVLLLLMITTKIGDIPPIKFALVQYKKDLRKKDVLFLILIILTVGFHFGTEKTSLALFMDTAINLTAWEIATVFGISGLWLGVFSLICGHAFDTKKNVFIFLSLGLAISGIFQALTPLANSYLAIIIVRILHVSGDAFLILSSALIISIIFPRERMGGSFGLMMTIRAGGVFLGALISGYLNTRYGYHVPLIVSGTLLIILSISFIPYRKSFNWRQS
ncbi:MFS transporter [candidate division NPL-UPA2 bacterium Unc8]|uniref:MFS transporter n=1 Tax=candidate division NPL-UPA2 bacterium Unc8 TaxID=1980939 RepID=A0A399FZP7_UNCN2|nr:MAG: MFS transporter [candidate division NPL-UPA2 bacterium Unc8]